MNFFEYVDLMKEKSTPVAIVGLGLLALFLVVIIFKMFGGIRRGTWRQLVRTGMTLIAAVVSYLAALYLSNSIIDGFKVEKVGEVVSKLDEFVPGISEKIMSVVTSVDHSLTESILLLPATIILVPLLCTLVFLVINLLLKIVRSIIIRVFRFKKAKKNSQRLGGAILSAIEGIIWIVMVTLPICGAISLVDQAYDKAINAADGDTKTTLVETYDEYLVPFTKNPAVCYINSVGADKMANGIATIKINGKRTNMREELLSMADVVLIDGLSLKGADFTSLDEYEKMAVTSIIDTLAESPYTSKIIVSMFNSIPKIYNSGLIPDDLLGAEYQPIINSFMVFFESSNSETLAEDLSTLKNFYFGFCDSGIMTAISNGEDIMQFITDDYKGEKHMLTMINTLSGNPRTQSIVDGLYNLVLNVAFSGSTNPDSGEGENDVLNIDIVEVKNGLNNIVSVNKSDYETEEEYREVLADTISTTINDTIGVELEEDVVNEISDYIDENYAEQIEDLTDEKFNEIIFEVIDIYQKYLNGEEINPDDFDDILGDDFVMPEI
ncbi:MAG: CvpA family protein [Clostridia bacterium]|nr:CvpA family protein [Clostridia bacterium]